MSEITDVECRFAVYSKHKDDYTDIHFVKEQVHYKDGSIKPNTRIIHNYERPFWVTKKGKQDHKSKKEWLDLKDLNMFKSTQTNLPLAVARALGTPWKSGSMRDISSSPYLYGTDILSTCLIKQDYRDRSETLTPFTNAVFDTETDVLHGTDKIIMATISFKEKVFTAVVESFVNKQTDIVNRVKLLANKYIGDVITKRNITLDVVVCKSEIDIIKLVMAKAHEWMPDFLSVWNIDFDMTKIIAACDRASVNIEDILCDSKVPPEYRSFNFRRGQAQKKTASGKITPVPPAQRWHSVQCPSSFYWIDAMCAYKQVRTGSPEEPSYALDAILNKHLKLGKLKFEDEIPLSGKFTGLQWHEFMQQEYPLEYIVYNMFDCISMEMLDEKTLDLQLSLPMFAGNSDLQNFKSQPRRAADALHFECLKKHNKAIGSTAVEMTDDNDKQTVKLTGLIVMLPPELVADNGLKIIKENPSLSSNIRVHTGDLDVAASYPNGETTLNVSKETTSKELISIEGVNEFTTKMQTINLSGGVANAVEFSTKCFGLPELEDWLKEYNNQTI